MSEELLIRRLKAALDVAPADPALRARVISSLPLDRHHARAQRRSWAPAIATGLAIAVVLGLALTNPLRSLPNRHPGNVPLSECQLPVYGYAPYEIDAQTVYEVGFLDTSTGKFTRVSSRISPADEARMDRTSPNITYDRAAEAWVPVRSNWVSADGMSYVYLAGNDIHIRSVWSQSDRVLLTGEPVALLGWSGGLIYYATRVAYASDLWALDAKTGKSRQVVPMQSMSEWWIAGPTAIWGSPYYSGKIERYDTKTHAISAWSTDGLIELVGLDSSGNPIVRRGDRAKPPGEIAVMHGDRSATSLDAADDTFGASDLTVVADGGRIWFSAPGQRLWVYSSDTGLLLLDQSSNRPLPNGLVVAGGCVSKDEVSLQAPATG